MAGAHYSQRYFDTNIWPVYLAEEARRFGKIDHCSRELRSNHEGAIALKFNGLVCHKHVALAITCLGSLLSYSVDDVELTLHDDGSLTEDDAERLRQALKCRVIFRAEAEEMMSDKLDKFPHCRDYRSINVQALKLLDVPLLHDDASVAFCDSDVLFYAHFESCLTIPKIH